MESMYHHDLRIAVFTRNPLLEKEALSAEPPEHFSLDIVVLDEYSEEEFALADVIIYDLPQSMTFKEMRFYARPWATFIVCITLDQEEQMTHEELASVDDIWITPFCASRVRLRLRHVLQEIKQQDDSYLHMLWLDTLMDSLPDLVWFKDLAGIHHKVNSKFCEFVKKEPQEVIGKSHNDIWNSPKDEDPCQESEIAAIETRSTVLTDEIVKVGETQYHFKTYKTPLLGLNGEVLGTVGFGHDLTDVMNMDMELNFFIESMPFPLVFCDTNERIKKINNEFSIFFEEDPDAIIGMPFWEWETKLEVRTSQASGEEYLSFDQGEFSKYISLDQKDILDIFGKKLGSVKIFRDITAEKTLENRIWHEANYDMLTGLANRHALYAFVQSLPPSSPLHLFYVDLDEFKAVNDKWGHKAGDEALVTVAQSMHEIFSKDFPARLGGDEFLICSTRNLHIGELEQLAQKLLDSLHEKLGSEEKFAKMSASIGILSCKSLGESVFHLIRKADKAMYMAKTSGKARYCVWTEDMGSADQ